jgi:hypothetical protein
MTRYCTRRRVASGSRDTGTSNIVAMPLLWIAHDHGAIYPGTRWAVSTNVATFARYRYRQAHSLIATTTLAPHA